MPATSARIGFIQEPFRRAVSTTTAAKTRHGNLARESEDPVETPLDSVNDAQDIGDARQALLSPERRRFRAAFTGVEEMMALDYVGRVPVAQFNDTDRSFAAKTLVSEIVIDLDTQRAAAVIWG